jgi:hypothetical protein
MSSQNYNGQVYGLYIKNENVFKEYLDKHDQDMYELYDDLLDLGVVFIDETFEEITIESAIDNSTFDDENKPTEDVPISKLTHGLTIITPDEISQISPEKLKIVLKHGNMNNVEKLQSKFDSRSIIIAINKLDESELKSLLDEDNFEVMSDVIDKLAFAE